MSKALSLFFAIVGTLLLAMISFFISMNRPWLAILSSIIALVCIGMGFIVKARSRRKSD
jgi:hypothetical protein